MGLGKWTGEIICQVKGPSKPGGPEFESPNTRESWTRSIGIYNPKTPPGRWRWRRNPWRLSGWLVCADENQQRPCLRQVKGRAARNCSVASAWALWHCVPTFTLKNAHTYNNSCACTHTHFKKLRQSQNEKL